MNGHLQAAKDLGARYMAQKQSEADIDRLTIKGTSMVQLNSKNLLQESSDLDLTEDDGTQPPAHGQKKVQFSAPPFNPFKPAVDLTKR